ncbi:MAG: glycosyltransferase family 1 protein [Actinomycetaceae bacterium]|nr:glycosyltransferase family 1 protein [Actinomycetaceae bacterium]
MRIAIKWRDVVVDPEGRVAGHAAGDTLVRRFIRIFDRPIVVGPASRRCEGFDVMPLEFLDPDEVVIVNFDVDDSPEIWRALSASGATPKIMNFVWRPVDGAELTVPTAAMALSCALFPTFANSERTANEVRALVSKWTVQPLYEKAKLGWVNLGFRLDHVKPRQHADVPVVLYPAIYLSRAKRHGDFMKVVERVRRKVPLQVEMRLHESHLVSEAAMAISQNDWVWVGPLTATRASYWEALARTTAFLATAEDESYGLLYVEAMGAGVVGIYPDRQWARALVPPGYPFLYRDLAQAQQMLTRALEEPQACLAELDECVSGSFSQWIADHHSDDAFDRAVTARIGEWFGA